MTTNHPEALDPALVRPGRVNMSIAMRNLGPEQAREMLERYFGDGSCPPDSPALAAFEGGGVSPAALEALCGQHDTVEGVAREIVFEKHKA